ncbi:MAG: hypothetical protein DVB31_14705 [Verrucomicrobia bacterium]|nr:MAG: hypothetical protein DVB31_14705 [Verrucomicrobiota bacterium]
MKPAFLSLGIVALAVPLLQAAGPAPARPEELFRTDRIWDVRLSFTPEQWKGIEPIRGEAHGPFGGGRPGGGPGGGGRGFGPGMFLAPVWMSEGDADKNGQLSAAEFEALGEKWFSKWDKQNAGKLTEEQFRDGLNDTARPGGRGPGGPGGRGGFQPAKPIKGFVAARHASVAKQLQDPTAGEHFQAGFGPGGPGGPGGGGEESFLQGRDGKRNGLSSAQGIEFRYVHADLAFEGTLLKDVAVRYKGNGTYMQSQGGLKRSFKIDLNEFTRGQKLASQSKLNLHNNVTDASWMNETLAYRLFRDAGVPAPRTGFARVYLSVPGAHTNAYAGLYSVVENIDTHFVEARYKTKKGAVLKPVTNRLFEYLGEDWAKYRQAYDAKTELSGPQIRRVIDFAKLVGESDDSAFEARVGDFLDLQEFADFMAVTVWISTMDSILSMGQNFAVYLNPKTDRFEFIPWDLDHAFGQFGMQGTQEQRENLSIREPWTRDIKFLRRVMKVEAFKKLYTARLQTLQDQLARPERLGQQVDELAGVLEPAVREEGAEKLERFRQVVAGHAVEPSRFGGPGGPGGPGGGRRGGPGGFGPGNFLASAFVRQMDADNDGVVTHAEFGAKTKQWFKLWNASNSGQLTADELRQGLNDSFSPGRGGPPPQP